MSGDRNKPSGGGESEAGDVGDVAQTGSNTHDRVVDRLAMVGEAVTTQIAIRAQTVGVGAMALMASAATPAAAQEEFCATSAGQFMGTISNSFAALFGTAVVAFIIIAALVKMAPLPEKVGNAMIGAVFVGLASVVVLFSFADMAMAQTPLDMGSSCGSVLGDG